jgi:DNA-binding response OmpR family regulator
MTITTASPACRSILILEDERALRNIIALLLESRGWNCVDQVEGGFGNGRLDAALLDLNAGDTNGLTVAEDLRRLHPEMPIVLMTGHAEDDVWDRVEALGHATILEKPFSLGSLEATLATLAAA